MDALFGFPCSIPPQHWRTERLAILKLFADDSGSQRRRDDVFLLAAYVAPAVEWVALTSKWQELLDAYGLEWFHMTDAESLRGAPYANWSHKERAERIASFSALISDHLPVSMVAHVNMKHWGDYLELLRSHKALERDLGKVYDLLAGALLSMMQGLCESISVPVGEIECVFAEPYDASQWGKELIRKMFLEQGFPEPTFRPSRKWPGLQAADMCAWLSRKRLRNPERPHYQRHAGLIAPHHYQEEVGQWFIERLIRNHKNILGERFS